MKHNTICERQMIDAIRELLDLPPLYRAEDTTYKYIRMHSESLGDGNRRAPAVRFRA